MKATKFLSLLVLVLLFSCGKSDEIDPNLLIGGWNLNQVTFNEIDGTEINDWISNSTSLTFEESKFYRNYVFGEWTLDNNILVLDAVELIPDYLWECEILELTTEVLKLRFIRTMGEYCCSFDEFEEDEVLIITETYLRP